MYAWIGKYWIEFFALYYVFSAFVSGMPAPEQAPQWGVGYQWFYTSMRALAGDLKTVMNSKQFPQPVDPNIKTGDKS